jgi:Fe-S-cluster-containing dehydrogenase component
LLKCKYEKSKPHIKVTYFPVLFQHCDNAPCVKAGQGAVYKREDGLVVFDPENAKGNKNLVDACPYGTKPRVYYRGLPKKYVAGTVYDPVKKEVIIGTSVTLKGEADTFSITTKHYGDF